MSALTRFLRALHAGPRIDVLPLSKDLRNAEQQGEHQARLQAQTDAALLAEWRRRVAANEARRRVAVS